MDAHIQEEKLEPVKNWQDDRRIRLLNRLYAKKRKALAEQKAKLRQAQHNQAGHQEQLIGAEALLESPQVPLPLPISAASAQDDRSVEELLSFIGGQNERWQFESPSEVLLTCLHGLQLQLYHRACDNVAVERGPMTSAVRGELCPLRSQPVQTLDHALVCPCNCQEGLMSCPGKLNHFE